MTFEWTITLGNVLSAVWVALTAGVAVFKIITNHIHHMEERINQRFTGLETDIRQLRDWVLVARDNPRD